MIALGLSVSIAIYSQSLPSLKEADGVVADCLIHVGREECLRKYAASLDGSLQESYTLAEHDIGGPQAKLAKLSPQRQLLAKSQAAWADFRDAGCAFESRLMGVGETSRDRRHTM